MRELLASIVWQKHVPGLIRFLSTLVLLILAIVYNLQVRSELSYSTSNHAIQSSLVGSAKGSQALLNEHVGQYLALRERGYIGDARRLQWIESFRDLAEKWQLPSMRFTLDEGRLVAPGDAYYVDNVVLRVTTMKVDMELAHEGDFYRLVEGLRTTALGLFSVEYCKLDWLADESGEPSLTRLRGSCDLNWYTLVDITETWVGEEG